MKVIALVFLVCVVQREHVLAGRCTKCAERCSGYMMADDCFNDNFVATHAVASLESLIEKQNKDIMFMRNLLNDKYGTADSDKLQVEQCGIGARYGGNLTSSAFTASSWYDNLSRRRPKFARLFMPNSGENDGGWLEALPYWNGDWLQVDLGEEQRVTGVVTQGQPNANAWPTSYKVKYGSNENELFDVMDETGENPKVFDGNFDYHTIAIRYFPQPVQARYIRFYIQTHYSWPALRVEIMEC